MASVNIKTTEKGRYTVEVNAVVEHYAETYKVILCENMGDYYRTEKQTTTGDRKKALATASRWLRGC